MFGATNIVKRSDKSKYVYTTYGIAFDGASSWSFGNDFARNVMIFGVDNSSSSYFDNCKNNFLVLDADLQMILTVDSAFQRKGLV